MQVQELPSFLLRDQPHNVLAESEGLIAISFHYIAPMLMLHIAEEVSLLAVPSSGFARAGDRSLN